MGELVTKGKKIIKESRFLFFGPKKIFFWREIFYYLCRETQKGRKEGIFLQ